MTKEEIKELKVGASVMHKRYGECVVKDILNVGVVLTPKTAKGRTLILTDYGKDAPVLEDNIGNIKHLQERMTNERPMTAAEHNAQVEAERRAYHERRCRESEGYKRVYEYITGAFQRVREQVSQGLTMTQQTMQQCNADATGATIPNEGTAPKVDSISSLFAVGILGWMFGIPIGGPDFPLDLEADKEYIEEYVKAETEFIHRLVPEVR
jgi:hypothetical protein